MKELEKLRKDIDRIDSEILRLLNERANAAIEIGKIKKEEKMAAHVPQRERQGYERVLEEKKGAFSYEALRVVFREIMSASLSLEQPLKVAYLGPKATFTYLACMKQFGVFANYIPVNSIKEVFTEGEPSSPVSDRESGGYQVRIFPSAADCAVFRLDREESCQHTCCGGIEY